MSTSDVIQLVREVRHQLAEPDQRVARLRLHGADGDPEQSCALGLREVVVVAQHHDGTLPWGEPRERLLERDPVGPRALDR